jgi:hypothetical protein
MVMNHPYHPEPEILEMPPQKMATVYAKGDPEEVFPKVLPDLYASVYTLNIEMEKQGLPGFTIGGLRARYPDAHLVPIKEWTNVIGLPIPKSTSSMPQKIGGIEIKIETWEYGTIAQILHTDLDDRGISTIERLHRYISDNDYEIIGVHEEEHITKADDKTQGVIIRYRITKK